MTRQQLFSTISITASSLVIWLYILFFMAPNKGDLLLMATFFLSFIVWLGSAFAGLFYFIRVRQTNREVIFAPVKPSIRQGFLISTTIAVLLFLQLFRVVSLWDVVLVTIVAFVFELAAQHSPQLKQGKKL